MTLFIILNVMKNPDPSDTRGFTPFNTTKEIYNYFGYVSIIKKRLHNKNIKQLSLLSPFNNLKFTTI